MPNYNYDCDLEVVKIPNFRPESIRDGEQTIKWISDSSPAEIAVTLVYYGDNMDDLRKFIEHHDRFKDAERCAKSEARFSKPSFRDFDSRIYPVGQDGGKVKDGEKPVGLKRVFRMLDITL